MTLRRRLGVLTAGPVRALAVAQLVAAAADALVTVALANSLLFNLSPEASRTQVLWYLALTMVPFTVLAPLVGPTIDRFRRGHRFVAAALFAIRALCTMGLAFTLFDLTFYVLALGLLMASKASGVVRQAVVPRLVDDPGELVRTNSAIALTSTIAGGIGGAIGASVLAVSGNARILLALAAVGFAAAGAAVLRLPPSHTGPPLPPSIEYAELHTPSVVVAAAGMMALRAGVGYFVFLLAFGLRRANQPAWVFGAAVASYGAGSLLANVVAPMLRRRFPEERLMAVALVLAVVAAAVGVIGVSRRSLVVVAFTIGLSAVTGRQGFDSLLQRSAPDALRGRAFASYETRFQLTWVAGGLLATGLVLPVETGMVLLTLLFAPVLVLYVRGAADARRFEPQPGPGELAPAQARLHAAEAWQAAGNERHAIVDAAAAADLALVSGGPEVDPQLTERLAGLRRVALDRAAAVGPAEVREAIELAAVIVGVRAPDPPRPPPSPGHPRSAP
jgi:MFS family permease